jgi:(p)ppGpp synthase/HD superfamily hydrolase
MSAMPRRADPAWFVAELPISSRAAAWAADAHAGQERAVDGAPFVVHALEVALHLYVLGYRDEVVAAAILHDVVEKTPASVDTVAEAFGPALGGMVDALTEDDRIADPDERKADLRRRADDAGDDVLAVFAADKVAKAREMRAAAAVDGGPGRDAAQKRAHYVASLEILERRLPDHPFTVELRFELEAHLLIPRLAWLADTASPTAGAT